MSTVQFIADTHTYHIDGEIIPSVTQLLKGAGLIDDTYYAPGAADAGTYVHQATALDDINELDFDALPPQYKGRCQAWRNFKEEACVTIPPASIERMFYHELWRYAGTCDRAGAQFGGADWILDIKCGQPEPWHVLQLAAYAMCMPREGGTAPMTLRRACVYLREDASYKLVTLDCPVAIGTFAGIAQLHNWKLKHGYLKHDRIAPAA